MIGIPVHPGRLLITFVLIDSDALCRGHHADPARRIKKLCRDARVSHHILRRRSAENYLTKGALYSYAYVKPTHQAKREPAVQALWRMKRAQRWYFHVKEGFKEIDRDALYASLNTDDRAALERGLGAEVSELFVDGSIRRSELRSDGVCVRSSRSSFITSSPSSGKAMGIPSFVSEPQVRFLQAVLEEIRDGHIQVPRFQRPFVWTRDQQTQLLNSIRDGLPIGAMMVWRTHLQNIACYDRLGPYRLTSPPFGEGALRQYLLDGHQRMATLYKAFFPPSADVPADDDDTDDPSELRRRAFLDLVSGEFVWLLDDPNTEALMPLEVVFDAIKFARFLRRVPEKMTEQMETAERVSRAFREYRSPSSPS